MSFQILLRENFPNGRAVVGLEALPSGNFKFVRIEAEEVQHCGVDVGDVMAIAEGMVAEFVGSAVDRAAADARAGKPDREAMRVMIAAILAAAERGAAVVPGGRFTGCL